MIEKIVDGYVNKVSEHLESEVEEIDEYNPPEVGYEPDDELLNNADDGEFRPARYDSTLHKIVLGPSIQLEVWGAPRKKSSYISAHELGHAVSYWVEGNLMPDIVDRESEKPIDTDRFERFDLYTQMWKSIHSEQFAEAFKRSFLNDYGDDSRARRVDDKLGRENAEDKDGSMEVFWDEGDESSLSDFFEAVEREAVAVITGMKGGSK